MTPQDQPKPRNNARKAAARELQRKRPELSYHQALAAVAESAGNAEASNPLHIRSLLNIASAADLATRHRDQPLNMTVPVGIRENGETVTLNIAHVFEHPTGTGPHGAIAGPAALRFSLALAVALRANNSAERIEVAFVGTEPDGRTAAPAVDYTVSAPWHAWLRGQLAERSETARSAQVRNLADLIDVPRLVVLVDLDTVDVDDTLPTAAAASLENAVRTGRSLGVHIILICSDARTLLRIPSIVANLTFNVTLSDEGQRRIAAAETTDQGHLRFTPAQFSTGDLTRWVTAARTPS